MIKDAKGFPDCEPPYKSHEMTDWRSTIVTLVSTSRFGQIRSCKNCGAEQAKTVSGADSHPEIFKPCLDKEEEVTVSDVAKVRKAKETMILQACHDMLAVVDGVVVYDIQGNGFRVVLNKGEDDYLVKVTPFAEDEEPPGPPGNPHEQSGTELKKLKLKKIKKVKDHVGILDVCLYAMKHSSFAQYISDLTTDGDNHDCEAIFHLQNYGYCTLKVR